MINFFKNLFGGNVATAPAPAPAPEVPYKVETTQVAEQAAQAVVESIAKPAVNKPAAKKPASKKPRRPRAPKVAK
jgi:hypothetical protein